MPNDCSNQITITASNDELNKIVDMEFTDVPNWAFEIKARGEGACVLYLWSRWKPDFDRLKSLIEKYPTCWIKDTWQEEAGMAGVWIGTMRNGELEIKEMQWMDMCVEESEKRFRKKTIHKYGMHLNKE